MRHTFSLLFLAAAPSFTAHAADAARSLPLFFIPNAGQADPALRYVVQAPELHAGFALDSAVFETEGTRLRVRFAGANPRVEIQGVNPMTARANFLIGDDPAAWHTSLPLFQGVVYRDLYAGIDMSYSGSSPRLKSEFLVTRVPIRSRFGWNIRAPIAFSWTETATWWCAPAPPRCANKRPWHIRKRKASGIPSEPPTAFCAGARLYSIWRSMTSKRRWLSIP
jgi:hypothetical protein